MHLLDSPGMACNMAVGKDLGLSPHIAFTDILPELYNAVDVGVSLFQPKLGDLDLYKSERPQWRTTMILCL